MEKTRTRTTSQTSSSFFPGIIFRLTSNVIIPTLLVREGLQDEGLLCVLGPSRRFDMETQSTKEGFWTRINRKLHIIREDLKKDSVASNPVEPVCCSKPPVYEKKSGLK